MATDNFRLFAPGVRVTEYIHDNVYSGTAEALVLAGLARSSQFPGQPGMAKSCVTFYDGERVGRGKQSERDEKFLRIQTVGKKFTVTQGVSKEIGGQRRSAYDAEREAEREVQRVAATAKAAASEALDKNKMIAEITLVLMPTSPNEYRQKLIADLDGYVSIVRRCMMPRKGSGFDVCSMGITGFALDESAVTEFNDLVNEIRELISNASVQFNAQRQKEIISNCKGAVARGDAKFQRVLAACIE